MKLIYPGKKTRLLKQRNDELEELSRTKDEFVALASHQLRTPATAVKQYVGMILQGYAGEITSLQRTMLEKAFESNERQLEIIHQILNAARADMGKLVMSVSEFDVADMIRSVFEEQSPLVKAHGHGFKVDATKEVVMLDGDSQYLRMAVENIISNADKYTPDGGKISLVMTVSSEAVSIAVSDTGVGIAEEDMRSLFGKFSRIHNELSVKAGGSGLGLYLAWQIVQLHGGSLDVKSQLGKGTTFTITLPYRHYTHKCSTKPASSALVPRFSRR